MSEYDGGLYGYPGAAGGAAGGGLETLAAIHDPHRGAAGMPLVNHTMHSPYSSNHAVPSVSNHVMGPVADGQKRDKDAIYGSNPGVSRMPSIASGNRRVRRTKATPVMDERYGDE
ncbi:unnamed protein product [Notodromas monacha]|uniref:Uncharacterized protein n=1 Tax=Notodromas monacha TaxID=399045 RepID=A0A7R9BCN8_9CRUS|nr:unnamed protein product [Notodromas monacha]CAG0912233.1 unnamed protein product [Notodromas monacha]